MAATDKNDDSSAGLTGSSEQPTLVEMFKSVLTELKDLKQTVPPLVEPVYEDERDDNVEQDDEELTAAGVDKRPAGDTGNKPTEKASIDLKDAYYTVPIFHAHQKYLKFMFNGTLYQYTCMAKWTQLCTTSFYLTP